MTDAIQNITSALTPEGVRLALREALSVAGRYDLAGMRRVVESASDRLYELEHPD